MTTTFHPTVAKRIEDCGVVAMLQIDDAGDAVPLAEAILEGGITAIELTLRTPAALGALKAIITNIPEILAGVGTILTPLQVRQVADEGAAFGVSPGLNPRVLVAAREAGLSFAPGILTPSDIEIAVEYGCNLLKFFPAEPAGGLSYLKAIAAPFAHLQLQYLPLGGLTEANMPVYLNEPSVIAVGGSWLAPPSLIKTKRWKSIADLAARSVKIVKRLRESNISVH